MSTVDVANEITNMKSSTAQYEAATATKNTGSTKIDSNTFMTLMLKELEYQDPMDPVSNKDFLSQQAQFTQLSTTQEMSNNIAANNNIMQTLTLVGKEVTLTDPNDLKKTITGTVSQAVFDGDSANVMVNGTEYPISLIKSVQAVSTTTTATK